MAKVIVISLDYDGCADILFDEVLNSGKFDAEFIQYRKTIFENFLNKITEGYDVVEIYVGSNRQDVTLDEMGNNDNKNGFCFHNYEKLCVSKTWIFKKLLLADATNKLPAETSISNKSIKIARNFWENNDFWKNEMLKNQFQSVIKDHPEDTIDFYFIDDDFYNIRDVFNYFKQSRKRIPENINFFLVQHQWVKNGLECIKEYGNIRDIASFESLLKNSFLSRGDIQIQMDVHERDSFKCSIL